MNLASFEAIMGIRAWRWTSTWSLSLGSVTAEAFSDKVQRERKDELAPGLPVRFVSIPTRIGMKEAAVRPRDLDDIQRLRWILNEGKQNESDR